MDFEDDIEDVDDVEMADATDRKSNRKGLDTENLFTAHRSKQKVISLKQLPWTEKYRPKSMSEVSAQDSVKLTLQRCIATGDLPHMLFYGPAGTGKTSVVMALARSLFGPEHYRDRVLELNASDERGIAVIREKVKTFAQLAVSSSHVPSVVVQTENGTLAHPLPPYKLVILDEADSMTDAAQSALRRLMEAYSKVTRFCILCNYVSRIIDPVASRCAKFRFQPLPVDAMVQRLGDIASAEQIRFSHADVVRTISEVCNGDMRRAVTMLQFMASLTRSADGGGAKTTVQEVTADDVRDMVGLASEGWVEKFLVSCRSSQKEGQRVIQDLLREGFSATIFLRQLSVKFSSGEGMSMNVPVSERACLTMSLALSRAEAALLDGADEALQLMAVAAHYYQACVSLS